MSPGHSSRGLTLTELLIALSLVSLIALAATQAELGARHYFLLDRRRSTLITEGMAALEHMTQTVRYSGNPRLIADALVLRRDNPDNVPQWPYGVEVRRTPNDPSDDRDVSYRFNGNQCLYDPDYANGSTADEEVLARYVNTAASGFALNPDGRTVTTTITTTTQGETAAVTSAASTRFLP